MRPKSFLNREIQHTYSPDYLFLEAIQFIHEMKTGPFHEHSPMLYDIAGVPNWQKVNKGLVKMYVAEVLKKVPIVQHFEFGGLIPWRPLDMPPVDLNAPAVSTDGQAQISQPQPDAVTTTE